MSSPVEKLLSSEDALEAFAAQLAKRAVAGIVIYLKGPLGAGKTTFARGFLRGLGYQGVVKSPTYTLVEPYRFGTDLMCYHFDLYRLTDPEELEFTGARDYFNNSSICLIEWPEKAVGHLADADIDCTLAHDPHGRKLTLTACSVKGDTLIVSLKPD
ncbi:MAG: tRNA (adenosine(37)-N6)-threonylcarbamoyltransferase complex ATPase subunit type 1 TsaE [Gammaproteobacteria bacterium]|jgi:tRNA threonylcarbamoyladenosine biosynthesis protein TsaE